MSVAESQQTAPETEPDEPVPADAPDEDEENDAEPEPEPESEPEPEALAPKSEKEIDKALKAVERAGTTYRNAVSRAMGEDANTLVPCPRCNAPVAGMVFPPEMAPVDDDTREAVLASVGLGSDAVPQLNPAVNVTECDRCDGWGKLAYPTKVPHVQEQQCPACGGQGYKTAETTPAPPMYAVPSPATGAEKGAATNPPCPICGQAGMLGQQHWCAPAAGVGV